MKTAESYQHLAVLFDYPLDKDVMLQASESLAGCLGSAGLETDIAPFVEYLKDSGLGELQEEYVRTFDFNPLCAPYLSHHLYGDNNKKGDFMISLKELYRLHAFMPRTCELPDHVAILFDCAAQLSASGDDEARKALVTTYITDGLAKMNNSALLKDDLFWRYPIAAAAALCSADCQEAYHA